MRGISGFFLPQIMRIPFNRQVFLSRKGFQTVIAAITLMLPVLTQAAVNYAYDANGRLIDVTVSNGESANYQYDSAGNIVAISRYAANALKLSSFSPGSGPVGSTVVLYGGGFSTTASQNAVRFNGVTATVSTATATTLTVVVPATATTGKISVTTSAGTATSTADFRVLPLPVIQQVTPMAGVAGTAVTITGTGFGNSPTFNRVSFNSKLALVTSASTTQLQTVVPANVGTGPIKVRTSVGTAVSTYFVIPPANLAVSDIASVTRVEDGVTPTVTFLANKTSLLTVVGGAAQLYSLQFSNLSGVSTVSWALYAPDNTRFSFGTVSATSPSVHLPPLAQPGVYTVALSTGAASGSVQIALVTAPTLTTSQSGLVQPIGTAYQSVQFAFNAMEGQSYSLALTDLVWTPSSAATAIFVYRPDGTQVVNFACTYGNPGCTQNLTNLPVTGRYSVVVVPSSGATGSFKIWLAAVVPGSIAIDTPYTATITKPGADLALSFTGTAGQSLALQANALALSANSDYLKMVVYNPDGSVLKNIPNVMATSMGETAALPLLPVSGTYMLYVEAGYTATGNAQLLLKTGAVVTGSSTPGTTTISSTGASARFLFNATAGDSYGLALTNLAWTPSTASAAIYVYRPDGTQLLNFACNYGNPGCTQNLTNLPVTGQYSVLVLPAGGATGSFKLWLTTLFAANITVDTPYAATIGRPGADLALNFAGTAGQSLALQVSGLTLVPNSDYLAMAIYKPDGSVLKSIPNLMGTSIGDTVMLPTLPVTGTYKLYVEAGNVATGSAQLLLKTGTAVTAGSTPGTTTISAAGASARFLFNATAGENYGLALTNLAWTPSTASAAIYVYRPDGTQLLNFACSYGNPGCTQNLTNLPVTGQYSVLVLPANGATGSFKFWLTALATGSITIDTPYTATIGRPGADLSLSFTGTAGQSLALQTNAITLSPNSDYLSVMIYKPDGSILKSMNLMGTSAGDTVMLPTLTVTGTYKIYVEAGNVATGSAQLLLKTGTAVTAGSTPGTTTISSAGASARFLFNANAGENYGLALTNLVWTPSTASTAIFVYRPDGTQLLNFACNYGNPGCAQNLTNLPVTGQYSVLVLPASGATGSFKFWLTALATGSMTIDTPYTATISRPGADLALSFTGTAGQSLALQTNAITLSPNSDYLAMVIYKPDGSVLKSIPNQMGTSLGDTVMLPTLPVSGTYKLYVETGYVATGSAQLLLKTGTVVTAGSAPGTTTISSAGASARLLFNATAGETYGLALTNMSWTPSSASIAVYVYRPDGTQVVNFACSSAGCTQNLTNLPVTGQYSVLVLPGSGATGSFKFWLTALTTANLTVGTPYTATIGRPGADLKLSFAGTAGQNLSLVATGNALTPNTDSVSIAISRPNATNHASYMLSGATSSSTWTLPALTLNGTYTIYVEATGPSTGGVTLKLQ